MTVKAGDRVIHAQQPAWGLGEVLSERDGKVYVFFVYAGEKTLKNAPLQIVSGAQAQHPLLDHRKSQGPRKGIKRKTVPAAIAEFLNIFPQGFADPEYFRRERSYKQAAHQRMIAILGRDQLSALVAATNFEEATARALQLVNATNLIFPNEKMALRDGLRSDQAKQRFAVLLHELLYGTSEEASFNAWTDLLFDIDAPKWTIATYFQFLVYPDRYIFFKPMVTQDAADVCNFELNYRPELNWLTYRSVQRFAEVLRSEIVTLNPRDMIDVQSFIWCIAPER
jgi:uncharacterized protein DUF3553